MFARTKRLTLRPGWPEERSAIADAVGHADVVRTSSHAPWPYELDDAKDFLSRSSAEGELFMVILSHEHAYPQLVGGISLHRLGDTHELGYWLAPTAWARGYATEAGHAVLDFARHALGLKRLVSSHFVDKPAAGRVLRELGFRETGRGLRPCRARGHDLACVLFERKLDDDGLASDDPDHRLSVS